MSTKCTISYDSKNKLGYHLYEECFENDNVWLQLDDAKNFKVQRDADTTQLTVGIPVEIFRHAVNGWLSSSWGQDLSKDHFCQSFEDIESHIEGAK